MELKPKISIIGCGNVGMRYAYATMIKGLARKIVIVDIDKRRAEGEVMDLSHGAPYVPPVEVLAGEYQDTADSDIVVITAGKNQAPGQTRLDLVKDNVKIFSQIIPQVVKSAPDSIIMVVTNPVDVLSYAAYKFSGFPSGRVIGSGTVLDSARFRFLLSRHCGIDPHNIHAYILGEHGDTEFAAWSRSMIGGLRFKEYCMSCRNKGPCTHQGDLDHIFQEVRNSAYKIIERKRETSYGIGLAMARITEAILHDENSILPVSSLIEDFFGIKDVYLSLPCVVNKSGVREIIKNEFESSEMEQLRNSASVIRETIAKAGI